MNRLITSFILAIILVGDAVNADVNTSSCTSNNQSGNDEICDATINNDETNVTGGEDLSEHCHVWAVRGECSTNPSFMIQNCAKSCDNVNGAEVNEKGKKIADLNENCSQYSSLGECNVNPNYMREFCAKSCNEYDIKMQSTPSMKEKFIEKQRRLINSRSDKCQLYMAESSIPNSGLGMYTAVDIDIGELVFYPEIVVSYFDNALQHERQYYFHQSKTESDEMKEVVGDKSDKDGRCMGWAKVGECKKNPNYMLVSCAKSCTLFKAGLLNEFDPDDNWLPDNYYWDAGNTDALYEAEHPDSLVPGIGALANSHTGLINVVMSRPSVDSSGLHESKDPGIGAFSTHYNLAWKATKLIPAGMEIFAEYGDNWFEEREYKFGPLPLSHDFGKADQLVRDFWNKNKKKKHDIAQEELKSLRESTDRKQLRMALPTTVEDVKKAIEYGTTARLTVPNVIRTPEWLEQNGICLDNIRPGQSTIFQAGRGAFATRSMSKGDVIAPLPMIHMSKERIKEFTENDNDGNIEYLFEKDQLILNYCYSHEKSSLLLFPYSPITNFVNHNFNHSAINAKVQWSTSNYQKSHWFNKTTTEILAEPYAGLMLEFVALRDIEEDEEIFIDYGQDWEDAWNEHVNNWKPSTDANNIPLHHLNHLDTLRTVEEQKAHPYSSNVMTICFVNSRVFNTDGTSFLDWSRYSVSARNHISIDKSYRCDIMKRTMENSETGFYDALVYNRDNDEEDEDEDDDSDQKQEMVLVVNIPRHAIEFAHSPYGSNQHLKTSFRHAISIPTEIFPSNWMNLE